MVVDLVAPTSRTRLIPLILRCTGAIFFPLYYFFVKRSVMRHVKRERERERRRLTETSCVKHDTFPRFGVCVVGSWEAGNALPLLRFFYHDVRCCVCTTKQIIILLQVRIQYIFRNLLFHRLNVSKYHHQTLAYFYIYTTHNNTQDDILDSQSPHTPCFTFFGEN